MEEPDRRTSAVSGLLPGHGKGWAIPTARAGLLSSSDVGWDRAQAQAVAEAIAQEAFHNVAYVAGTFEILLRPTASKLAGARTTV